MGSSELTNHLAMSEFHFLPPNYTFMTLITLSSKNSSRIPLLEALDHLFFMCVCCVRREVMTRVQKYQNDEKKLNN
jgi:hypothetical protein